MNTRLILYTGVGVLVVMMMQGGGTTVSSHPFAFQPNTKAFFEMECLKEVVALNGSYRAKLKFCGCTADHYSHLLMTHPELKTKFDTAVTEYQVKSQDSYARSRSLAHVSMQVISSGHVFLDQFLRPYRFMYSFPDFQPKWDSLSEDFMKLWKNSIVHCSQETQSLGE